MRTWARGLCVLPLLVLVSLQFGCGSTSSSGGGDPSQPAPAGSAPARIAIVVLENLSYADVMGASAAPYLNQLANQYGKATNYFANTHPSIGNYFMMTTGQIVTNDDNGYQGPFTGDNLARSMMAVNKTWKVYAQGLPSVGYTGTDQGTYVKHHNPFAYFSDVVGTAQANNIVPETQLASDIAAGSLPNYLFIVPDNLHNGHDCPGGGTDCDFATRVATADQWVKDSVAGLLSSPAFQNGVLIVTFDEADFADSTHGGGHIATVIAGPKAKAAFQSSTFYQHENLLRLTCDILNLQTCPGSGAGAASMTEFVQIQQ